MFHIQNIYVGGGGGGGGSCRIFELFGADLVSSLYIQSFAL